MMYFERLANELLLDLFEYFDGINLIYTFYGLNYRLNTLLRYHIDFRSISKSNFSFLCKKSLSLVADRVLSLSLSNDDETPNLPELFFSYGFILNQFIYLKSLSIYGIYSNDLLNQMIDQCHSLLYLEYFKLIHFSIDYEDEKTALFMNEIWKLSLIHCRFEDFYAGGRCFSNITTKSYSIKYLSIHDIYCDLNVLYHLFEYTPNLQQLSIPTEHSSSDEIIDTKLSTTIKSLKLSFESSIEPIINLLKNLPNLFSLTLKTSDICLNGYEWEKIIENYLPNLKKFRLKMIFEFNDSDNKDEQVNNLLETFQTCFWIKQHQWFIQCDWDAYDILNQGILYTLPYNFDDYVYFPKLKSQSTYSTDTNYSYNHVNILRQSFSDYLPLISTNKLTPKFNQTSNLTIKIPCIDLFFSSILLLKHLKTLDVIIQDESAYQQLQILLDHARYLQSLKIRSLINFQINRIEINNPSLHRLDIMTKSALRLKYFNSEECFQLSQSSIGKQCQVLLISIENRQNISDLIQSLPHLRSLTIQCKDDKYQRSISTNDQFIQWLSEHLSSEYFITRDKTQTSKIHIWIQ